MNRHEDTQVDGCTYTQKNKFYGAMNAPYDAKKTQVRFLLKDPYQKC